VTLHVEHWGTGQPVVFIHGLGGSTRTWDRVRLLVEDRIAGTTIDLLGFGRSAKPDDVAYDVECHLAQLGDLWFMCRLRYPLMAIAPLFARSVPAAVARDALRHTYRSYSGTLQGVVVQHRSETDLETVRTASVAVTAVHGSEDDVVPLHYVTAAVPSGSLRVVAGSHHLPIDNPAACADAISSMVS
jgi:pimeloyl-ACP methyl ester carboxylesterase